ncbi:hypothetical protein BJX70DRAFT_397206 [Aspergillus crustosus]
MSEQSNATCNCGSIKVTVNYNPGQQFSSVLCHCANCVKASGSSTKNPLYPSKEQRSPSMGISRAIWTIAVNREKLWSVDFVELVEVTHPCTNKTP